MSITKTSIKAGQFVDSKHVDTLLSNYKKERWLTNSKNLGKEDSLSVWYGINELSTFMETARANGADGIRMYFGVYPEGFEKVPAYSGRQTIVMVATKAKLDSTGRMVTKHIYYQTEKGTELLAFNISYICPPMCGTLNPGDDDYGFVIQDQGLGLTIMDNDGDGMVVL